MSSSTPPHRKFRAVIIGGGPVGLCLAHALTLAGIDYVLLERRDTVIEESGLGLALWPHGVRVLDQIGLLEEALKIWIRVRDKHNMRPDGSEISHTKLYDVIEQNHGHPWMLLRRQEILELMFKRLPERESRVLTNKKVVAIETHADGVKVRCSDGSVEEGSIAVGCDGVHSEVRQMMRELVLASSAKMPDPKAPMVSKYQLLAGHVHRLPHIEPGHLWEVRDNKFNMQIFMLENEGWYLVYRRLPKPVDHSVKYTAEDAEAFAKDIMDRPISKDLTFKDMWEARKWTTVVNVEEGNIKKWSWDRIVLLGDSVHKMAPNSGLALNQGWQGVVALTNGLRRLLSTNANPDTPALTKVFDKYKSSTVGMANASIFLSEMYLRVTTWDNFIWKVADQMAPYLGGDLLLFRILASPIVKKGLILDDVPEPGHKAGKIPWDNKPFKNVETEEQVTPSGD